MSYEACNLSKESERLAGFYQNFANKGKFNHNNVAGGFVGGTAATGGMSTISEYADSVYSKAKEDMIRKIASDMNDILGLKGDKRFKTDGAIENLVAKMNDILPNPRKKRGIRSNKGSDTKYSSVHKELCKALAESINKNYGTQIIDLEQSDNALCNSVAEIVHSLIMGMHSEFSTIAADVSQVIRNLTVLTEYLKRSHEKMKQVVDASNDENIKLQSERVDNFYVKLVAETERQLAILNNMMGGVIGPVNNDFVSLMKESEDFKGFVEDIKSSLGSEEFGNKLGYLLAGVNNLAQTAKMVDKALKEIGMSVKSYKNTSGIENLRDEIYSLLAKSDKLTADGLVKFMKAADVLYRNDLQHEQIVEYLEKGGKSGGGCPYCGASGGCGCGGAMGGNPAGGKGDFKEIFERKETIEYDKFKAQNKARKAIFRDFEKQLLSIYQRIIAVVQQIGPKIGSEIQSTDDLMKFVRAFNQIEGANRSNIAQALSGYTKSGAAKDVRNSFLSSLDVVDITLDPLVGRHALFKDLRNEINILMKLVETFSTKFVDALVTPPSFVSTTGGEIGGEIGGVIVNTEPPVGMVERYASFGRAQFQLYYFSRIASIKRSMARAAAEKKATGEDYEKMVGQASARLINEQAGEYKVVMDSLAAWNKSPADFKNKEEFDKALPEGSPGRALYFYVNTLSGYEPTFDIPNRPADFWKGNLTENGCNFRANNIGWNALAFNAALPAEFLGLWNFQRDGNAAHTHTPSAVHINNVANQSLFNPGTNFLTALGVDPADFTHAAAGTLPRALDRKHKDASGKPSGLIAKRYEAAGKLVEVLKELEASAFAAKKDLIEVAQNIDLYLSSFTDSMLSKPEALLSLAKILQRVAVVRKMYTDNSGDNLAKVFEMFPVQILNNTNRGAVASLSGAIGAPAQVSALFGSGVRKPGQALADNVASGEEKKYDRQPHYYDYVKSVLDSNSSIGNHKLALDLASIFDQDSNHSIAMLLKTLEKSVLGIRALENILLAFVQLGNEQTSKTFMSHGKVLKSLFNYIIYSSISRHYVDSRADVIAGGGAQLRGVENTQVDLTPHVPGFAQEANTVISNNNRIQEKIAGFDLFGPLRNALSVSLNQISAYNAEPSMFHDDFKTTDNIMELILKAICSKVLTVLGLYQIYNRPTTEYLSFGAIRSIIGGGSVARPKIIPEAIDLYVRVPLLLEWFRDILVGKSTKQGRSVDISTDNYMLALIPDVTNQFGELLKTIFIKAENVDEGNYSEDDTNCIITEINKLYNAHKSKNPSDTVSSVCEAIISEVNSRYSIVKKHEVDKYWDTMKKDRFEADAFDPKGDEDYVDFDLLDSANGVKGKPAPSDRYMDVTIIQAAKESGSWSSETFDLIRKLHARMFQNFRDGYKAVSDKLNVYDKDSNQDAGKFDILKYSFDGIIRQYKDELKLANSEDDRYKIACKAIQDVGKMADINPDKIVMLHEFVVSPLTTLMSTYNLVRNVVESFIWMSKEGLDKVLTYLDGVHAVQQQTIGAACAAANQSALGDAGNATHINTINFNRVLENSLRLFNVSAAPLLQSLFVNQEDAAEHAAANVNVFNVANVSRNAHASLLLSTKKLFKMHMQLFAGLKSALGDKFSLNFTNQSYPILDMSALIGYCENLLNNVKKALVYLRPNLPPSIIRKYEKSDNVGSVYWLEEHMFSELFYNEKNWTSFEDSRYAYPGDANGMVAFANNRQTKINATLPLLNQVLKSSFGTIVRRSQMANGKALCERGLLELCAWGLERNQRLEGNNDAKTTFPFNVIDFVDDLDPAVGKVRRMLLDKSLQAGVAEIAKKFGTLEINTTVAKPLHDRIYNLLRLFSVDTSAVAGMQVPNLDAQANKYGNPKRVTDFLTDTVTLFMDETGGAAATKIGTPSFGTFARPFAWNGQSGGVASIATAVGIAVQAAGLDETIPTNAHPHTFAEFKGLVDTAITAAGSRIAAAVVPTGLPLPAALVNNNLANIAIMANRVSQWIVDQMGALDDHFAPYIRALDELENGETKTFLEQTLRVPNAVLVNLGEVKKALSQYRFAIGFRHLVTVTTYGAAAADDSLGLNYAGDIYFHGDAYAYSFSEPFNNHLKTAFGKLLNYTDGVIDHTLRTTIMNNIAQHSTNISSLVSSQIDTNLDANSNTWRVGVNPFSVNASYNVMVRLRAVNQGINQFHEMMGRATDRLFELNLPDNASVTAAMAFADTVVAWNIGGGGHANFQAAYAAGVSSVDVGFGGLAFLAHLAMNANGAASAAAIAEANAVVARSCAAGAGNNRYITAAGGAAINIAGFNSAVGGIATHTFANLVAAMSNGAFAGLPVAQQTALILTFINALESALVTAIGGFRTLTAGVAAGNVATPAFGANTLNDILLPSGFSTVFRAASVAAGAIAGAGQQHGVASLIYANSAHHGASAAGIFAGIGRPALANITNSELLYAGLEPAADLIVGYPALLTLTNVNLTGSAGLGALNTVAQATAASIATAFGFAAVNPLIIGLSAAQVEPLDGSLFPKAADVAKAEAWLRSFVARYIGTPDMNLVVRGVNKMVGEQFGVGLDNISNVRARFEGLNVAFVVNRVQLYEQWGDQGMLAVKESVGEQSIFNAKGLLVQFNQLLAAYIGTFIEPGSKKFYAPLVEGLINGKISDAITSGNAIADINIQDANGIGIPPEGTIVCASIARAIRSLLYKKLDTNNKESQYATNSLLEVAGFMKETMKGNLPHFAKMFTQLADIAVMYKKVLLDNPLVKYERPAGGGAIPFDAGQVAQSEQFLSKSQRPYLDPNNAVSEHDILRYYRILLDNLELACNSVLRCISQCYKELNDMPLFGETYSGSIMEIKQRTGKYPLTLPSVLQSFLHHKLYNKGFGLPSAKHGSDNFKLLFMSRRMVVESDKVSGGATSYLEYMPGLIETINNYNGINSDATKLPKALIESSIKSNFDLMNILFDLKLRSSWILDSSSCGASLFRREIYGSALAVDLDQSTAGAGFNSLNQAQQIEVLVSDVLKQFARNRGLSWNNQNQSIYQLSDQESGYEFNLLNAGGNARTLLTLKRANNAIGAFNNNDRYPNLPGGPLAAAFRVVPADADQKLVSYSDILQYPTSLVSYAFASSENIADLITLCESTDLSYNKRHLLKLFAKLADNSSNDRRDSRFYNILDLNVVPIDFHALQRKVPLINLLNYAFTFDKYVVERLGVQPNYGGAPAEHVFGPNEANVTDVKSAFARMLIHPYAAITPNQFNTWHSRIAVGATGSDIPMDRPKYFSDQIYNKVCLQSLNPSDYENPGGPGYMMENKRSQTVNLASVNAAFTNAQTAIMLAYAVGNNVGDVTAAERDLIRRVLVGVNGAAGAPGIINIAAAIAAAGAPVAPAGVNLTPVYANAMESALVSFVNNFNLNPNSRQLKDAIIRGIREVCAVARAAANQAAGVINIGRVRYTHAANAGGAPQENEVFTDAVLLRTITLHVAESLQGNFASQPLAQKVDALYYIADADSDKVKRVDLSRGNGSFAVNVLGKLRYDTRLVRNLSWITHLHRFLIWSIKQSLVKQSQPVVNDAGIIDPTLIDFRGYETQSRKEYHL